MTHKLTNDQKNVRSSFLPLLTYVLEGDSSLNPDVGRDATVLNRAFVRGADPLFIMEMMGDAFETLCNAVGCSVEAAREGIELAHTMGPGVFVQEDKGFDIGEIGESVTGHPMYRALVFDSACDAIGEEYGPEVVWLLLAECSTKDESGFDEDVTLTERLRSAMACVAKATKLTALVGTPMYKESHHRRSLLERAARQLEEFRASCVWTTVETEDAVVPLTTEDVGFYVAYKQGWPCAAVQQGDLTFFGTQPSTTLAECGIAVHKEISPHFGIAFNKERAQ